MKKVKFTVALSHVEVLEEFTLQELGIPNDLPSKEELLEIEKAFQEWMLRHVDFNWGYIRNEIDDTGTDEPKER